MDMLEELLPVASVEQIRGIPRPIALSIEDELYWSATPDDRFTLKSAYQQLHGGPRASNPGEWNWIWRIPCIKKLRTFLWLILHDRLLTNLSRFR